MPKDYERARLAHRVRLAGLEICDVADALQDLKVYDLSTKGFEIAMDVIHLERELLELPAQTGVPTPEQHDPCAASEDVPF